MRSILIVQIFWAILSMAWNIYGVDQLQHGGRPPGPTASVIGALVIWLIGMLIWFSATKKWTFLYVLASLALAIPAAWAVYNAFVQDPSNWPSEGWRWAGILLNSAGSIASFAGIGLAIRKSFSTPVGDNIQ